MTDRCFLRIGLTRVEKVAEAQRLRAEGLKLREIGEAMDAGISTVSTWLGDPDLSRQRARRDRYRGTCTNCGAKTDGSNGVPGAPSLCLHCTQEATPTGTESPLHNPERYERLERLWKAGKTIPELMVEFDCSRGWVCCMLGRARRYGYDIPHRYSAERRANIYAARFPDRAA